MKVLVTGAAGQLGSSVCRALGHVGIPFLAVDKVGDAQADHPLEVMDLLDPKVCEKLLKGVDVLAHFANHSNWYSGPPQKVYGENVRMNMNLFQAAADQICQRIVFASSIQVFNGQRPIEDREDHEIMLPYLPIDAEMPAIPRNSYALSKQAAESMLKYFSETARMTCISIRFPWLLDLPVLTAVNQQHGMKRGQSYDGFAYLPLYSAAEAIVKAINVELSGYRQYFVASKDNLEQRPAQQVISEQLSHLQLKKPIEEMDSLVNCRKAESELGWRQPQSLVESIGIYQKREIFSGLDHD